MSRNHITMQVSYISCGILEVGKLLSKPKKNIWEIGNYLYHPARGAPHAFIMMSDTVDSSSSELAAELTKLGLALVTYTPTAINPKTGSVIRICLLLINHEKYKAWYKTEAIKRLNRSI